MGINLIQTGRFNRLFQKFFSIKGTANVTEVGAEILPVFAIPYGVEHRYLEGWNRFGIARSQVGGAGTVASVRLRNPAGSNIVAVFERINAGGALADTAALLIGASGADLATILAAPFRVDPRGQPNSSLIASANTAAGAGPNTILFGQIVPNAEVDFVNTHDQEIPLLPGDVLEIRSGTNNQTIQVSFLWRERAMEESELK
jgi:hypothetical protein